MEIPKPSTLEQRVFSITNEEQFREIAQEVFYFQYFNNSIYQQFCKLLHRTPDTVKELEDIPFLPISFFKTHEVITTEFEPQAVFESSGTTGHSTSRHFVKDVLLYEKSFLSCFRNFFGQPSEYCIIGLLPSYLERKNSSLVYMVNRLIELSEHEQSGFYLHDHLKLAKTLKTLEEQQQKTILFGVTYALLHFAEQHPLSLHYTTVIETGGMKGRKKEITRAEVNHILKSKFRLQHVHSEYGMTELLSQAYAVDGVFQCPPWMQILFRDETDPLSLFQKSGAVNVIDLANIWSCSFIATDDAGKMIDNNAFEISGRLDNSDIRGCSLLAV